MCFLSCVPAQDPRHASNWRCIHSCAPEPQTPVVAVAWQLQPDADAPFIALATAAQVSVWCHDRCAAAAAAVRINQLVLAITCCIRS